MNAGTMLGNLFLIVLFAGCARPGADEGRPMDFAQEIRRNSEIIQKDSTDVVALIALGNAYIEKAKTFERRARESRHYHDRITWYSGADTVRNDLGRAVESFSAAIRLDSLNDKALTSCGHALLLYPHDYGAGTRWQKSRAVLRQVIAHNPSSAWAYYVLGKYADRGQKKAYLEKALQHRPDFAEAYFELGEYYGSEGPLGLAHANYHRALQLGLSDPLALYLMADNYEKQGSLPRLPVFEFLKALGHLPAVVRLPFVSDLQLFLKSRDRKIYELYREAHRLDPQWPAASARFAYYSWRKGDKELALDLYNRLKRGSTLFPKEFYEQVISRFPECAHAYADLAAKLPATLADPSILLLKRAISLKPDLSEAYYRLFYNYRTKAVPDSARKYLEEYARGPGAEDDWAHSVLAWLYVRSGNIGKFADLYHAARGRMKEVVLSGALPPISERNDMRQLRFARTAYAKLSGPDPRQKSDLHYFLSECARIEGDSVAALKLLEKSFKLDQKNEKACWALVGRYERRGQLVEILRIYQSFMKDQPENTDYLYAAIWYLEKSGRQKDAAPYYRRINQLDPTAATEQYESALMSNQPEQALWLYQRAARLSHKAAQDTLRSRNITW